MSFYGINSLRLIFWSFFYAFVYFLSFFVGFRYAGEIVREIRDIDCSIYEGKLLCTPSNCQFLWLFICIIFFYFGTDSPLFTPSALPHRHTPTNPRKKRGCVVASFYLAPLSTHTHTHPTKRKRDRKPERRKESGELIRTKKSENR